MLHCAKRAFGVTFEMLPRLVVIVCSIISVINASGTRSVQNNVTSGGGYDSTDSRNVYTIGFLYTLNDSDRMRPAYYLGGIKYAIEHVNSHLLKNISFKLAFRSRDTRGDVKTSLRTMTSWSKDTIGFIGPDDACYVEAYLAAAWRKPIITYNCQDSRISDSAIFDTFARTIPSTSKISQYIFTLLRHYKWTAFSLIYQDSPQWREAAESLERDCEQAKGEPRISIKSKESFTEMFVPDSKPGNDMDLIIRRTYEQTRVYVFLGDYDALLEFVREMFMKNLINGEYVVISVMDVQAHTPNKNYFSLFAEDEPLKYMVEAFQVVLLLEPVHHGGDMYLSLIKEAANYSIHPPFNLPAVPHSAFDYSRLPTAVYGAYLYDAVYIMASAIKEVLSAGSDVMNGTELMRRTRERNYSSILGNEMYIDALGESQHIFSVLSLKRDPNTGRRQMAAVGGFSRPVRRPDGSEHIRYIPDPEQRIEWMDGKPPATEPKCGFDGRKCHWPIAISCVVAASVVLIISIFGCRHYIYEQKLDRLLWKIESVDLLMAEPENDPTMSEKLKHKSYGRLNYYTSFSRGTSTDDVFVPSQPTFFKIASYKGALVAVKGCHKRHVEINRAVKLELHHMKEMSHDNINRFIGACLDSPTVCIVTQYCTRGSLKDIIENDDLPLDEMFTASLVFDLIRGMIYLHDSEIVSHGNLTPSNCLVDSRWVLQIADFGIHFLRASDIPKRNINYEKDLYKAPELLRMRCPPLQGTQKGDVYSFGMILHEIHGRSGPWGNCPLSPKDIVDRVKSIPITPDDAFRPDISRMKCGECILRCMGECWDEEPDVRPDFKYIRFRLKPMQRGLRSNIFDNMLAIMEKYANTLEAIVEERTNQLVEEKKKTEALLLRMLPKPVAEQLKRGESVEPEQYNLVTIYFSDIVGFTSLSAESTPLEVVTLLNDLYTMFDSIIGEYDVYKVETIGDAYMVVSGLPIRNSTNHAGEIASMSLHLLSAIQDFKIRHQPNEMLKLRIGIHSGPCVAGVVGLKMPRYCLFGDTVNTASRMESTGIPLKIHCSSQTKDILEKLGGYHLQERGFVLMKGKGEVFTYFLVGEDISHRQRRMSLLRKEKRRNNNLLKLNNYGSFGGSAFSLFENEQDAKSEHSFRVPNFKIRASLRDSNLLSTSKESVI